MTYLLDDTITKSDYSELMELYVKQMAKTAELQEKVTALHNKNLALLRKLSYYEKIEMSLV